MPRLLPTILTLTPNISDSFDGSFILEFLWLLVIEQQDVKIKCKTVLLLVQFYKYFKFTNSHLLLIQLLRPQSLLFV